MGRIDLPYVEVTASKGHTYYYYRRDGRRWGRINGDPGTVEFALNYEKAVAKYEGRHADAFLPQSFGALIHTYLCSAEYQQLKPRTKTEYRRHLDAMGKRWRDLPLNGIERGHVLKHRDELAETPGAANTRIKILTLLLSFAVDRGAIPHHPALKIRKLKEGERLPWPDQMVEQFRASSAAEEIKRAFELALYTGQRLSDLAKMAWTHWDGRYISVAQEKTGKRLRIPCHPSLLNVLAESPRRAVVILTTPTGKPWTKDTLSHQFTYARRDAGIDGYVFGGLRRTAAVMLAEAGCSIHQIQSITGHRTTAMVEKYTEGVNQRQLADDAIAKLTDYRRDKK